MHTGFGSVPARGAANARAGREPTPDARPFATRAEEASGLAARWGDLTGPAVVRWRALPEARPLIAALAAVRLSRPVFVLTHSARRAEEFAAAAAFWLGAPDAAVVLPQVDQIPYELQPLDADAAEVRAALLARLAGGDPPPMVVAGVRAATQHTADPLFMRAARFVLALGDRVSPAALVRRLARAGYQPAPLVEAPGQYARRGGIVDVFPPGVPDAVRVEFFGNEIESLRAFDVASQRSRRPLESVTLVAAREISGLEEPARRLLESANVTGLREPFRERWQEALAAAAEGADHELLPALAAYLQLHTVLDYLPEKALLIEDEPEQMLLAAREARAQAEQARAQLEAAGEAPAGLPLPFLSDEELADRVDSAAAAGRLQLVQFADEHVPALGFTQAPLFASRLRQALAAAAAASRDGSLVLIASHQEPRIRDLLATEGIAGVSMATLVLPGGWRAGGSDGALLLTDHELFGLARTPRAEPRPRRSREPRLPPLQPGDHVVHIDHGIGRFAGLVVREDSGAPKEYLEIHYAEGDRLFVPVDQIDRVTRYVGPSDHPPAVDRLGSSQWHRTRERVRRAVTDLARDLLTLYAAREVLPGHAFAADSPWQHELEASFPYVETPDQLAAMAEIKADLESPRPMDRLLVGDVGYGKTELALRAGFKTVMDGRQVAFLVPTTVLAQQHLQTFRERLAGFPLRVESLSRLRPEREQREVIRGLRDGSVDIVIGTHRLLQKDVDFKDLGLLIIDEEHRFGVLHKERLKQLRQHVDALTLTATPIPRTLHMALAGIRDLSLIDTPPEYRLPIKTYVERHDPKAIREAILRELGRGGQVFYLHNRVFDIAAAARRVLELVPEARVAVGHGQMDEGELERVMLEFVDGAHDVLVCTTIIESGLDIPNVNTIIIEDADRLGLAQLYQLRGRVGRGTNRAYAHLFYGPPVSLPRKQAPDVRPLTPQARKRLQTIFEAQQLGAGMEIALRDLQIRGAGNVLGAEQSGHIGAVGFELYNRMLGEAVRRLRAIQHGEQPPPIADRARVTVDLPLAAYLPQTYVPDRSLRLSLYQELAGAASPDEADAVLASLRDRFGEPPAPVLSLVQLVRLRELAERAGCYSVTAEQGLAVLRFSAAIEDADRLRRQLGERAQVGTRQVRVDLRREDWPRTVEEVLQALAGVSPGA